MLQARRVNVGETLPEPNFNCEPPQKTHATHGLLVLPASLCSSPLAGAPVFPCTCILAGFHCRRQASIGGGQLNTNFKIGETKADPRFPSACFYLTNTSNPDRLAKGPRWLGTVMPLAGFMLQLIVLITFIEIAPSDLPKTCSYEVHAECCENDIERVAHRCTCMSCMRFPGGLCKPQQRIT